MWNSKRFWYGMGAGMIIAATLLRLMSLDSAANTQKDLVNNTNSPADQPHGLTQEVTAPKANGVSNEFEKSWTAAKVRELAEKFSFKVYPAEEKRYTEAEFAEIMQQELKRDAEAEAGETIYIFTIKPGMGTGEVAEILLEAALIDEKQSFQQLMTERELHYRIQPGVFRVKAGTSLEEIANIITN